MKSISRKKPASDKPGRVLHDYDYESLFGDKEKKIDEEKERFDKNFLSEDDLDRIKAII